MNFSNLLINWYLKNDRNLPWRKNTNPYYIWLSEIMLQQTRAAQGTPYFLKFIKAFPTVFDLANATEEEVLKLWQGLGYYSRARNLHFTANYIVNELNGVFPSTYKELLKLKGVGDYTASAIASICFNENTAVVDGNVYRVLSRYFGVETPINTSQGIKEFKQLAQKLIDSTRPGVYNQAIMDFGATHCKPKNPYCNECFFADKCEAFHKNSVAKLPVKLKKITIKKRYFNYLFIVTPNKTSVLKQRTQKGIWQGLYEFPLIETKTSIDYKKLVEHPDFNAMFSNDVTVSLFHKKEVVHKLSHQHLYTKFWVVKTNSHSFNNAIKISSLQDYPVPVLIDNFLKAYLV